VKKKIAATVVFVTVTALTIGSQAFGHDAGACHAADEPGNSEYAKHHVVFQAQMGTLGAGRHKTGAHQGFSLCLGVHD
jgi:hypothetical protein